MSRVGRHALEAGDDATLPRGERLADAVGPGPRGSWPCRASVSVTIPACEPVNDTAGTPRSMIAMQSSAIEMRSPAVSSMSISRPCGLARHVVGEAHEVVGGLAHRRDHDDDVVAVAPGAHDVVGDGPDAVGVGDRGAAELLDEQAHDRRWYRGAASPDVRRDSSRR